MTGVLLGFSVIAVVILAGVALAGLRVVGPEAARVLSRIAYTVANPALLFGTMADSNPRVLLSTSALVALVSAVVAAGMFIAASRLWFRRPLPETVIGATGTAYANAANIGIPVATFIVGDTTAAAPLIMLQLVVFAPAVVAALDLGTRGSVRVRDVVLLPVKNPLVIATVAGVVVALLGLHLPTAVRSPVDLVGGAAVPMMLMAFGISLWGRRPLAGADLPAVLTASAIKTLAMPAIAWLVAGPALGLRGHALFAAVAMAALPTAQNVMTYANWYVRGETIARDVALVTTVVSIPALMAISALLT